MRRGGDGAPPPPAPAPSAIMEPVMGGRRGGAMPDELAGAKQAVATLLPLAVQASGGIRPGEDRHDYLTRVRQLAVDLWLETTAESETVRRIAELAACRTFPAVLL